MRHEVAIGARSLRLRYLTSGRVGRPAVVFVHGLSSSAGQFRREVVVHADRFRTLAVSLRGHGGSTLPPDPEVEDFSVSELARDVTAVLDQEGITRAHLVGNSLGGLIGLELRARVPERVASLVTFGTPVRIEMSEGALDAVLGAWQRLGSRAITAVVAAQARPGSGRRTLREAVRRADMRALLLAGRNLGACDYTAAFTHDAAPWLVLRAGRDRAVNRLLDPLLAEAARANPGVGLAELPKAGHFANLDDPDGFDAALRPFLERAEARERAPSAP